MRHQLSSRSKPTCCSARPRRAARQTRPAATIAATHQDSSHPTRRCCFSISALGFNSHKIHIDRAYARDVEGLPDLVVNGGLATLLLTEFLRVELGLSPDAHDDQAHRAACIAAGR